MSWRRRLFLRPSLRITEQPWLVVLPDSAATMIQHLLPSPLPVPPVSSGFPVQPTATDTGTAADSLGDKALAELGLQVWRLRKRVEKIDPQERRKERRQFEDSAKRLERVLNDAEVVIDDPIGKPFVDGWVEIEVIAWEPVEDGEEQGKHPGPWIKDTVKPIIRKNGTVISTGQVIVATLE